MAVASAAAVAAGSAAVACSSYYFVGSITFADVAVAYPQQDAVPSSASVGSLSYLQLVAVSFGIAAVVEEKLTAAAMKFAADGFQRLVVIADVALAAKIDADEA